MDSDEWVKLVHRKYDELGFKLYRPGEWTVLAGILELKEGSAKVVALGTGVKCLPASNATKNPPLRYQLIRDSHAEVLARRALLRYLLSTHGSTTPGRLVMYISHAPCGDASMHLLEAPTAKRVKLLRGRDDAQARGLRTKPGRRDAPSTECLSCGDKIAFWGTVGWQGALAGMVLGMVQVEEIVIGEHFEEAGLQLGINGKITKGTKPYKFTEYRGEAFKYSRGTVAASGIDEAKIVPSSVAQVWYQGGRPETLADGRRLGSAKHHDGILPVKSQSCISTESIGRAMGVVVGEGKRANLEYQRRKASLFCDGPFIGWPVSDPQMKEFRDSLL